MKALKYLYYVGILLLLLPLQADCQYGFRKVIDFDNSKSLNFDDIQFHKNRLFISGNAYIDSVGLWGQNFAVFDTNGILLWEKTFIDTTANIVSNTPSRFFINEDGNFLIPISFFERDNLGLLEIDSAGNRLFMSEFPNPEFTIFSQDIREINNSIYLFGTIDRTLYRDDVYIIKTDHNGVFQWIKYFGDPNYHEDFGDVIENGNGTFTISSTEYPDEFNIEPFGSQGWKKPWIFTIDTSGLIISQWFGTYDDPKTLGGGPFYHMKNGDWIIISQEFKGVFLNGSHFTSRTPTITKLDSLHNLEWKLYMADYTGFWDSLLDLEYDSLRNEFVAAGHRDVQYTKDYGELEAWVVKFTPEGEILWSKSDTIWSDRINGVVHFTAGVDISQTGSIYAAGRVEHENAPRREYGWILKMNPDGCFDTLCTTTSLKDEPKDSEQGILYPNPTRDYFVISFNEVKNNRVLILYNNFGRIVKKVDIQKREQKVDINFIPGMYFYTVFQDNVLYNSGKLIVD